MNPSRSRAWGLGARGMLIRTGSLWAARETAASALRGVTAPSARSVADSGRELGVGKSFWEGTQAVQGPALKTKRTWRGGDRVSPAGHGGRSNCRILEQQT
jgi:hypothetical protein